MGIQDDDTDDRNGSTHTDIYTVRYDWESDRSLSGTLVSFVADIKDVEPIDLYPLHGSIDPDALDQLFAPTSTGDRRAGGHISFTFEGYHVTVYGDGEIVCEELSR